MTALPESEYLDVAHWAYPLTALGPGRRLGLWVAGCPLACKGCITPQLWQHTAGRRLPVNALADYLAQLPLPLDGLSLSGGEPFVQPLALAALCRRVRQHQPNWTVLAFTGYPLAVLQRQAATRVLLAECDVLVAGPYVANRPSHRPLLASANQRLHALTPAGVELQTQITVLPLAQADVGSDGQQAWLFGILTPEVRQQVHQTLRLIPTV